MKIASLKVGQCLTLNNTSYEIVRLLENDIIQLEAKIDFKIINRSKQELLNDHETGKLKFAQSNDEKSTSEKVKIESRDLSSFSDKDQQIAKLRMDYIREARARLGSQPRISELDKVVLLMAQNLGDHQPPSAITLYRWWTRWESSSQDINCLVPKKRRKGCVTAFSKSVLKSLNNIIQEDYLNRVGNNIQDVYDRLKFQVNNFNKTTSRPHKMPSRSSVYRYCKNLDQYEVLLARKGKRVAKQAFRVTGEGVLPDYILARTEIDHTPLDLIIVDDKTFLPIGRPNLTCIIDKFSRVILGFSLSFEPPSELSVIRALKHALFTKTSVKELYPDLENDWVSYGIPMCLVVDNGLEFHSKMLRQLCYELNVELVFCPKQQPQFKGCIERTLGTLNRGVSHQCEGTTFNNIEARGDYDSADQARVTLKEVNELITHWIVDVYHQRRHSITGYTPDYLWKEGLVNIQPRLPESLDAFELASARPYNERRLAHDGVRFKYLNYNSVDLQRIRQNPRFKEVVNVRINHENLGYVWVHDEYDDTYIKVECTQLEYAKGLTLLQHEKILEEKRLKSDEIYDEEKYLEGKEKLRIKMSELNSHKLLKERKRAARLAMATIESNSPTENIQQFSLQFTEEQIGELGEIPEFESYLLGGQ